MDIFDVGILDILDVEIDFDGEIGEVFLLNIEDGNWCVWCEEL